jgi:fucose permease
VTTQPGLAEGQPDHAGPDAAGSEGVGERRAGLGVPSKAFAPLVLYSFIVLGLPDGAIGTAWPVLRKGFGAPLADLGVALLIGTVGSTLSASVAGLAFARLGARATILLAGTAGFIGALGIAVSPTFWVFAVSCAFIGLAAGLLDSTVNTTVTKTGRNRLLNMVHGSYGVGATLAPLVVTAAVLAGSWRASYCVILAAEALLVTAWWAAGRSGPGRRTAAAERPGGASLGTGIVAPGGQLAVVPAPPAAPSEGLPRSGTGPEGLRHTRPHAAFVVGLGLLVFMVYTGLEVSAGQWSPSFDRGVMHMGAGTTGLVTFGYWGSLTVARFALAVPRKAVPPRSVVRWGCAASLLGAALVWWRPAAALAPIGLVVVGAALAGVFPALIALTPARVGEERAHYVIGWQIGAAGIGGSAISALFGVVFQNFGLAQFGPALVAVAALLVVGSLVLEKAAP